MPEFQIVYEHPFVSELDVIEPNLTRQVSLCIRIEAACIRRVLEGWTGYGFTRISWTRDLLAWYQTNGTVIYLLSVKYDLIVLPRAA
jgi:hypothetical protein